MAGAAWPANAGHAAAYWPEEPVNDNQFDDMFTELGAMEGGHERVSNMRTQANRQIRANQTCLGKPDAIDNADRAHMGWALGQQVLDIASMGGMCISQLQSRLSC